MSIRSLLEHAQPEIRRCARLLVSRLAVQLMASDTHSRRSRPPMLQQGLDQAATILAGRQEAEKMVRERARGIMLDSPPQELEPQNAPQTKRGFFSFLYKAAL